jgi:hypothetical protein
MYYEMTEKVEHKMCMYWLAWLAMLSVLCQITYLANTKAEINFVSERGFVHAQCYCRCYVLPGGQAS